MAVQKRLTAKALQAAAMIAQGKTYDQIAEELSVSKRTICNWAKYPEVQAEFDRCIGDIQRANYAKAMSLVHKQLDNEKLPWLAQGAARIAIESFDKRQNRTDGDVTIRFEAGQSMPEIGVPASPADE